MCLVLTAVVSYLQRDINVFGIDTTVGIHTYNVILMCLVLTAVVSYLQRDINVFGIDNSCFKQLLSIPNTLISRCKYETTDGNTKHINITL